MVCSWKPRTAGSPVCAPRAPGAGSAVFQPHWAARVAPGGPACGQKFPAATIYALRAYCAVSRPSGGRGADENTLPQLAPAMQASPAEIYLYDAATLQLLDASQAARDQLGYSPQELAAQTALTLAPQLSTQQLAAVIETLGETIGAQATLQVQQRRRDASLYPLSLRLSRADRHGRALLLAVADELSTPQTAATALAQVQSRFNAIVSNTPGLVYQFCLQSNA